MSFRRRIALVSAAAVAIAVALASLLIYVLTSHQLHSQIDAQLRDRGRGATELLRAIGKSSEAHGSSSTDKDVVTLGASSLLRKLTAHQPEAERLLRTGQLFGKVPPSPNQVRGYQQLVDRSGSIVARSTPGITLPVDASTTAIARHGGGSSFRDARVEGVHMRILTEPFGAGRALQFAQPLTEVDGLLGRLRLILALVAAGGVALAALLGRLVAGTTVGPLRRLTRAAEHVAATRDLSQRIASPAGNDEIARLARSFNAMLDALERSIAALDASVDAQRQLVADASHELRTPVTSVRTNIEILQQRRAEMDMSEQDALLGEVVEQIGELALLINDLIELARGEEPHVDTEAVRLDLLVEEVVDRFRRRLPDARIDTLLEPTLLTAVPARLERAVSNLIDNALKYSPPGSHVEVALRDGELAVRDHGPGIAERDMPHVFDRFYRGAEARGRPGSGLGLAIVRQLAEQHGGSVSAEHAPGGGTVMRLRLPVERAESDAAPEPAHTVA